MTRAKMIVAVATMMVPTVLFSYDRIEPSDTTIFHPEPGSLGYFASDGPRSPGGLLQLGDGEFLTLDNQGRDLVVLDTAEADLTHVPADEYFPFVGYSEFLTPWREQVFLGSMPYSALGAYSLQTQSLVFQLSFDELWGSRENVRSVSPTGRRGDYIVVADALFYRDAERKVRAISPAGELLSHDDALVLMDTVAGDPAQSYADLDPVIAQRNRELRQTGEHYVVGGRYYTTEWDELKEYLNSIEQARDWWEAEDERSYWDVRNTLPLVGYDQYHNSYWGTSTSVRVLSPTGQTLGVFSLVELWRENRDLNVSGWALEPDGTTWALAFILETWSRGTLYLYRFDSIAQNGGAANSPSEARIAERPSVIDATITVPPSHSTWNAPLGDSASVTANVLARLSAGSRVSVVDQTEPFRIGTLLAPWYCVATADATEGRVYGAFLEFAE